MQYLLNFKTGILEVIMEEQMDFDHDRVDLRGLVPVLMSTTNYDRVEAFKGISEVQALCAKGYVTYVSEEDMLYGWHCGMDVSIEIIERDQETGRIGVLYCVACDDPFATSWLDVRQVQLTEINGKGIDR